MARAPSKAPPTVDLELGLDDPDDNEALSARLGQLVGPERVSQYVLRRRTLDARAGRVRFHLRFEHSAAGAPRPLGGAPLCEVKGPAKVVIVGEGPAGLFCAYELARLGIASLILDRGKGVQPRRRDLKKLNQGGIVDSDSNYCFGEGGAGTYSDGKLYTRSTKRGDPQDILEILALHGAPENILVDARPHIGSNRLPMVITALREQLEARGVEFHFGKRVTELLLAGTGSERHVTGVRCHDGQVFEATRVVLATGHSARDVFELLARAEVALEAKPFALGVRVEHPQPLINDIQFGTVSKHPKLGSAAYSLTASVSDRGVFSFCMCPGGFVVPAATEPGGVVVNGMSLSRRDSRYANSGIVVTLGPDDTRSGPNEAPQNPLAGVALQRAVEQRAFLAGGGALVAPATRLADFLAGKVSSSLPKSSYVPGLASADLGEVFDPVIQLREKGQQRFSDVLRAGLTQMSHQMRGYATNEAVLIGVETRTSSPVRVPRDPLSLESPSLRGLYPCGEGAGYAGGIVSAALDGQRVARRIGADVKS